MTTYSGWIWFIFSI